MGCDMHAMVERRMDDFWINSGNPDLHRDYEMFSVLSGVRNSYGIKPISEPKGKPDDLSQEFNAITKRWSSDGHSHSWLSLAELKAFDLDQEFDDGSLIVGKDSSGQITSTCASTSGTHMGRVGRRKVFSTWGRGHWDSLVSYMENVREFHKLSDADVRLVFFFDN